MCICVWYLHFRSGCVAKLWAGSWVFPSQVPLSSSGHWTYGAPSSPPQIESDNNGPLERKRGLLIGCCPEEIPRPAESFCKQPDNAAIDCQCAHTLFLFDTHNLFISYEQRNARNPALVSSSTTMSADKHRKSQFVKHHAVVSFVFLLCVHRVCMQRPPWQMEVSSRPSNISPNVNSINAGVKEGMVYTP